MMVVGPDKLLNPDGPLTYTQITFSTTTQPD